VRLGDVRQPNSLAGASQYALPRLHVVSCCLAVMRDNSHNASWQCWQETNIAVVDMPDMV
jgi:hypothetical protein